MPSALRTTRSGSNLAGRGGRNHGSRAGRGRKAASHARSRPGTRRALVSRRRRPWPGASFRQAQSDRGRLEDLLLQALETEQGGIQVYETALRCVRDDGLRREWERCLEQTREHERILLGVFDAMGLDGESQAPGRRVVRAIGESLVLAMQIALEEGTREAAETVAAECIVLAETKGRFNWELLSEAARAMGAGEAALLLEASHKVEDEEDERLYHAQGWARELWMRALGLPAVLPPLEEPKDVRSASDAALAKASRKKTKATA